jgi:putative ABC transport system substrate-binding protein
MRTIFPAVVLVVGTVLVPAPAEAQAPHAAKIPRVGYLSPVSRAAGVHTTDAFRDGLAGLGYVDGKNIAIEARFAEGKFDRVPELTRELMALNVDVIAVLGAVTVRGVQKAARDVPVVFAVVVDPVADGLVTQLEHPGANTTGVTTFDPQQPAKQLELLKKVLPRLERVAFIGDQGVSEALMNASEGAARALGIRSQRLRLSGPTADLEKIFAAVRQEHADAVVALEEPAIGANAEKIAALALKYRIPAVYSPLRAEAGFLFAYGTSLTDGMRGMASYIDKILKGAKPGDLPVQALRNYELTVNLKTSRALGIEVPAEVLKRANHVIQ